MRSSLGSACSLVARCTKCLRFVWLTTKFRYSRRRPTIACCRTSPDLAFWHGQHFHDAVLKNKKE